MDKKYPKNEILNDFKSYLLDKGFSSSSVNGYFFGLRGFLDYLANTNIEYTNFSEEDVKNYLKDLNLSPQTKNVVVFSIKKYCLYLSKCQKIFINIDIPIFRVSSDRKFSGDLNIQEVFKNIRSFQKDKNSILRDELIFNLLYYLGIRVSDLVKLKVENFSEDGNLNFSGKRIFVSRNILNIIKKYITELDLGGNSFLFSSLSRANRLRSSSKPLSVKSIEDLFNRYVRPINNDISIKDFRGLYQINNKKSSKINKPYCHNDVYFEKDFLSFI